MRNAFEPLMRGLGRTQVRDVMRERDVGRVAIRRVVHHVEHDRLLVDGQVVRRIVHQRATVRHRSPTMLK